MMPECCSAATLWPHHTLLPLKNGSRKGGKYDGGESNASLELVAAMNVRTLLHTDSLPQIERNGPKVLAALRARCTTR